MGQLNAYLERHKSLRLAVRVDIHTGLVVVGEMGGQGRQEQLALGEVPNVAAQLQGLAEPNTVVIGAATHGLIHGYFACQALGSHTLKGVVTPVHISGVFGESLAQSRLDVATSLSGTIPRTRSSANWRAPSPHMTCLCRTSCRFSVFALRAPERQKQKTLAAVLAVLLTLTAQRPVLLIVEDLHWIDPSTLELLSLVLDQGPTARVLTVLTCRPEFRPPWGFRAHLTFLTLSRLPRTQTAVMVERVAQGAVLPTEVVQQVMAKTDGVPLFVEELTKMVLESGLLRAREDHYELTGPLPSLAIPTTLHDSPMARLDRLAAVKAVAQCGATLGRSFSYDLLHMVSSMDETLLQRALGRLVDAELLYQRGGCPHRRPTSSSMPSFRRRPISRCSRAPGNTIIGKLPRCWRHGFRRPVRSSPSY
jgi:hypothetical protein